MTDHDDRAKLEEELCMHGYLQGIGCAACEAFSRRATAWAWVGILLVGLAVLVTLRGGL